MKTKTKKMQVKLLQQDDFDKEQGHQMIEITFGGKRFRIGVWDNYDHIHISIPNKVITEKGFIHIPKQKKETGGN